MLTAGNTGREPPSCSKLAADNSPMVHGVKFWNLFSVQLLQYISSIVIWGLFSRGEAIDEIQHHNYGKVNEVDS